MRYYKIVLPSLISRAPKLVKSDRKGHFDALLSVLGEYKAMASGDWLRPHYGAPAYRFYTPMGYAYVYEICGTDLLLPIFKGKRFKTI